MTHRLVMLAVVACWLASMSWLFVEKILPTIRGGQRPDFDAVLPAEDEPPQPVCWEIMFNGESIGRASSLAVRDADGAGHIESTVDFERLPLSDILSELLGSAGAFIKPLWMTSDNLLMKMSVASRMEIASGGNLKSFVTNVRLADLERLLVRVRGEVHGRTLSVSVYLPGDALDGPDAMRLRFRDEIDLPDEALVGGALSPQSQLANLHVGQTWTFPVYRPFPPNSPLQMVEARVERREVFLWNGQSLKAFQVVYRDDAGSGISIARQPIGKLWVRDDGEVLEQETRLANLNFRFVRLGDADCSHAPLRPATVETAPADSPWP
jgi:hypothetical protein